MMKTNYLVRTCSNDFWFCTNIWLQLIGQLLSSVEIALEKSFSKYAIHDISDHPEIYFAHVGLEMSFIGHEQNVIQNNINI